MSILILGFPQDAHIHAVRWALDRVGVRNEIIYTSDFPQVLRSSIRIGGGEKTCARFGGGPSQGATGAFDSVWFRRAGLPMRPASMNDADWTITQRECDHYIRSMRYHVAPAALWVNDIDARERALLKALQLEAAQASGFTIPETLFGNDPDEIRRFYAEFRSSGVIFKLSYLASWHDPKVDERYTMFTTQINEDDLRDDAALSDCPGIYQRKIEKKYELRVTCMDETCFTVRLDSQSRAGTRIDWRADFSQPTLLQTFDLPARVHERCIALMKRMGLKFGCIDLLVTPDDEYVFLEVNEMGQFLWVEKDAPALPLLRAFATLLVDHKLKPGSKLVGDDTLSFQSFLGSGAWDAGWLEDAERHAEYKAPGVGIEA